MRGFLTVCGLLLTAVIGFGAGYVGRDAGANYQLSSANTQMAELRRDLGGTASELERARSDYKVAADAAQQFASAVVPLLTRSENAERERDQLRNERDSIQRHLDQVRADRDQLKAQTDQQAIAFRNLSELYQTKKQELAAMEQRRQIDGDISTYFQRVTNNEPIDPALEERVVYIFSQDSPPNRLIATKAAEAFDRFLGGGPIYNQFDNRRSTLAADLLGWIAINAQRGTYDRQATLDRLEILEDYVRSEEARDGWTAKRVYDRIRDIRRTLNLPAGSF